MDILDRFIAQAKENINSGYYDVPKYVFPAAAKISLKKTLLSKKFSLIAEIKHASPAGEYSFDNIDVAKAADTFKGAGADALSVVVEPKIFKGNLADVPVAKRTGLPVLCKDFFLDETQIRAAAEIGADCVLFIMKVADRLGLDITELINAAHSLELEVLLECYDRAEMKRAQATNADILGINNRDLQTLKVDIRRTKDVMETAGSDAKNRPVVSESGIKTREDAEFVKTTGVNGILVGTSLWKTNNQAEKIKELKILQ